MRVTIKHYFQLKQSGDSNIKHVDLAQDSTVDDLLPLLGIKQEDVGILVVNGKEAAWGQHLKEHDVVSLIPHIGGG